MKRFFNTTGACRAEWHYMVPPVPRLPEAPGLIAQYAYFVVHAPRQTGKTTTLIHLAKQLLDEGQFAPLYFSCEEAKVGGDNVAMAEKIILKAIRANAELYLPRELQPPAWPEAPDGVRLRTGLSAWAEVCPKPLVLFFDEIDALRGDSLVVVLSQLRAGFTNRPRGFPASVVLCGLRDVRDYKAASGGDPNRLGSSSPFNVKIESLKLGNFEPEQVQALYLQHTAETGQVFAPDAIARAIELTGGQPWLVNALAREVIEKIKVPSTETITIDHIEEAKERLILARATHLDSLVARLMETRVKPVIETVMAGLIQEDVDPTYDDNLLYCRDLGLIAPKNPVRIANPIYKEVVARVLSSPVESQMDIEPHSFILADGRLDMRRLLDEFVAFWSEHGDLMANRMSYHEAAAQLVFMAFLQRVVNGGGFIDREYGVGRGRVDLLVRFPYKDADGKRGIQREAIELKVWREKQKDPLEVGLKQIDAYLDKLKLDTGILVIFDRRKNAKSVTKRVKLKQEKTPGKKTITLLRA
jgi:hypothetical protein